MLGNPTKAPRIVPFGATRLASDRLPNGRIAFRVTQRFGDLDAYFRDRPHGAMDIGNTYCDDTFYAMLTGTVAVLRDPNGALGVRITTADRLHQVEMWHLRTIKVANGAKATKGATVIGTNGSTGLDIGGCHCHIVYYRNGVKVDPWRWLDQNVTIKARFNATTGINLRSGYGYVGGPMRPIWGSLRSGRIIRADGVDVGAVASSYTAKAPVKGATHGIGSPGNLWTPIYVGGAYRAVATPLITYL